MATVPAVAYLGDRYKRNTYLNKWVEPFKRLLDFQQGQPGEVAQNNQSGYTDGWDGNAHNSTYSDEILFNGRQVSKCFCPQGTRSFDGGFGGTLNQGITAKMGETIWCRSLVWLPDEAFLNIEQTMEGGGSLKFMRLTNRDGGHVDIYISSQAIGYSSWWHLNSEPMTHTTSPSPQVGRRYFGNRDQPFSQFRNRWLDVQYAVTFHDTPKAEGGLAEVYFWINGERVGYTDTAWTMNLLSQDVHEARLSTYVNVGSGGVDIDWHMYCAEFEVTNVTPSTTDALGYPMLASKV